MLQKKRDITQHDLEIVDLKFVKSEFFLPIWNCGSRQQDTASSGWIFQLNKLAVE